MKRLICLKISILLAVTLLYATPSCNSIPLISPKQEEPLHSVTFEQDSSRLSQLSFSTRSNLFNELDNPDDTNSDNITPRRVYNYIPVSSSVINTTGSSSAFDGYNMFVVQTSNYDLNNYGYSLIFMDMEGNILKQRYAHWPVEFVNSTIILGAYGSDCIMFWNLTDDTEMVLDFNGHHELEYNPINNTIFTFTANIVEIYGRQYIFDIITEFDMNGEVVWSLDSHTFISHTQWCPFQDGRSYADVTHSNSIIFDSDEDVLYYNPRNVNTFYKIDYKTGDVLWGLGEYGDFALFDRHGTPKNSLFYHPHAVEQVDDNTFILFDNDLHNQTNPANLRSRILEITINETTMTANESWSWIAPPEYYCQGWGDADRLPNGNRLGVFGSNSHPDTNLGARLVEVNDAGEIVWETNFVNTGDIRYGVYRMERFRYSPILSTPSDFFTTPLEPISTEWDAWYNFRPKRTMSGTYTLFLDGAEMDTGVVAYDKFWRHTTLTFNLEAQPLGVHNLTLAVTDEEGHITTDSVNVTTIPFHITREGPVSFERGQADDVIKWLGSTCNPLFFNISVNSTLHSDSTWNGEIISLDLSSLEDGNHQIVLQLFNGTELVHTDSFWVSVYPLAFPIINPFHSAEIGITWNDTLVLSWELFDRSPSSWHIYIDDVLATSDGWTAQHYLLNWTVPVMDEDTYNITIVAIDCIGQWTTNTTWLTVNIPSPPIVVFISGDTEFQWGQEDALLVWFARGGYRWILWKDGIILQNSSLLGHQIGFLIEHWQDEYWGLGTYNLTIEVIDTLGASTTCTHWIRIKLMLSDAYANAVEADYSQWYRFGDKAVGIPDGGYALIFFDYENGYLTLDMGLDEEILDGTGADFQVVAQGGEYTVRASNNLATAFTTIGYGQGILEFDLGGSGLSSARYIRIDFRDGSAVELDGIAALFYNYMGRDTESPLIIGPQDFFILETQPTIAFTWNAYDETPWNYSITVDGTLYESGPWIGSDILFTFEVIPIGTWVKHNVILTLYDLFSYQSQDAILIDVLPIDTENPQITGPEDFWVLETQPTISFVWETYDLTPVNYSIFVNGLLYESNPWTRSDLFFNFSVNGTGTLIITLILCDFFGQKTEDEVLVEIRSLLSGSAEPVIRFALIVFVLGSSLALSAILFLTLRVRRLPRK